MAGVWYQTSWSMNVNVTNTHQLAMYFLDYPNEAYAETITIKEHGDEHRTRHSVGIGLPGRCVRGVECQWNVTVTFTSTGGIGPC